jgi:cytochrome c553
MALSGAARGALGQSETARAMRGHFDQALGVHEAVIRGDVAAAGERARLLADQLEQSPRLGSPTALAAAVEAAHAVRDASDVLSAAQATATLLSSCGRCHRAAGVKPWFAPAARTAPQGVADQMRLHQAAADQLVHGLIVPSDAAWRNGARTLSTAPLSVRELPLDPTLRPQVAGTEERLRRLASDAVQVADPRSRAAFYAQFLAACADCHARYAVARKPPAR